MEVDLVGVTEFFKLDEGYFVAVFELSVVLAVLLDSIVRQMNVLIIQFPCTKINTTSPYIPLFIPIGLQTSVNRCQ